MTQAVVSCAVGGAHAADAHLARAFDLATDTREEHDLAAEVRWPQELLAAQAAALERALAPLLRAEAAQPDPERAAELRDPGYF